jgi:hypothetical protein
MFSSQSLQLEQIWSDGFAANVTARLSLLLLAKSSSNQHSIEPHKITQIMATVSNRTDMDATWTASLGKLTEFLVKNGRAPVGSAQNREERRLAHWWLMQRANCKAMPRRGAVADDARFATWTSFMAVHAVFLDAEAKWAASLAELVAFCEKHERGPSMTKEKRLARWVRAQKTNAKLRRGTMADGARLAAWEGMMKQFPVQLSTEAKWRASLAELVDFIERHERAPSMADEKQLASWVGAQKTAVKRGSMTDDARLAAWTDVVAKYPAV